MKRRYPLTVLEALRRRVTAEQLRTLAAEVDATERARVAVEHAKARERAVADEMRHVNDEHAERLERGEERAADLARAAEWRIGAELRVRQAEARRAVAEQRQSEQLRAEDAARTALADAKAEEHVIERHREGWMGRERARDEAVAEADAADALAARSKRPLRGGP